SRNSPLPTWSVAIILRSALLLNSVIDKIEFYLSLFHPISITLINLLALIRKVLNGITLSHGAENVSARSERLAVGARGAAAATREAEGAHPHSEPAESGRRDPVRAAGGLGARSPTTSRPGALSGLFSPCVP